MIAEFLTTYSWVFWVTLLLVFVIIEVATVDFTFLMLAIGSLGGLVAGLLSAPLWSQILIAGIFSLILLFVLRPALQRALGKNSNAAPTNVAALLGLGGTATAGFIDGTGYVKLSNGETWTARLSPETTNRSVESGEKVVVTAIEGATAVVAPAERNPS